MRLLFLGSGSAQTTDVDNFQSNMLLIAQSGRRLLIDCGSDIRRSLAMQGLSYLDITDIYISHLHADHIGGLECIGFQSKFDPRCARPRLYIETSLAQRLWEHSLCGGMGVISEGDTTLATFFDVCSVDAQGSFQWEGARFDLVPVVHVCAGERVVYSYGLLIHIGERVILLTTDTRFNRTQLESHYANAGLIFQDCETGILRTGVHVHYDELLQLPDSVRCKMWLYDYPPGTLPDAVADGFRGFVLPGQCFDLLAVT